jgi:transposase
MESSDELQARLAGIWPLLDERTRRLVGAYEAIALGHGGISAVSRACGLSRKAIAKGVREIQTGTAPPPGRIRRPGAGRKKITERDPGLADALERLIEPETRGDPESPLRWTCKSTRTLAAQLTRRKHPVSHTTVAHLLHEQGYSLQSNRKTEEGGDHPDRDAQFRYINTRVKRALSKGLPVISVDTKKKERSARVPLRRLRPGAEHRLRERGDGPRHRGLRRGVHPRLVAP